MDRSSRQKINKAREVLNDSIDQLDLIHIYRTLHPKKTRIYILLKHAWSIIYSCYFCMFALVCKESITINYSLKKIKLQAPWWNMMKTHLLPES